MTHCTYNVSVDNQSDIYFSWELDLTMPSKWSTNVFKGDISPLEKTQILSNLTYSATTDPEDRSVFFLGIFDNDFTNGISWVGIEEQTMCKINGSLSTSNTSSIIGSLKQDGTSILITIKPKNTENYTQHNLMRNNLIGVI
jgi:hypothetical protein